MAHVAVAQTTVAQINMAQLKRLIWTGLNKVGSNEHGSNDLAQKRRRRSISNEVCTSGQTKEEFNSNYSLYSSTSIIDSCGTIE